MNSLPVMAMDNTLSKENEKEYFQDFGDMNGVLVKDI